MGSRIEVKDSKKKNLMVFSKDKGNQRSQTNKFRLDIDKI